MSEEDRWKPNASQKGSSSNHCPTENTIARSTCSSQELWKPQTDVPTFSMFEGVSKHAETLALTIKENAERTKEMRKRYLCLKQQRIIVKQENDKMTAGCQRLMGELFTMTSESSKCRQNVEALKRRIARTLWEKYSVNVQVASNETELEQVKKVQANHDVKMEDFRKKIVQTETQTEIGIQLSRVKQEADECRARKAEVEKKCRVLRTLQNGVERTEIELLKDIRNFEQRVEIQKRNLETKRKEERRCSVQCERLRVVNQIRTKKNSALLTRGNRKVDEHKETYDALKRRGEFLQRQIELTKEKLRTFEF